jgi:HSP20 family protein
MPKQDTISDLLRLQERMNRLFEDGLTATGDGDLSFVAGAWAPAADLIETGEHFILQVDLPGLGAVDYRLEIEGTRLKLRGTRHMEHDTGSARFDRLERSYGLFARTFDLGILVDEELMQSELVDGVLRVVLPKRED